VLDLAAAHTDPTTLLTLDAVHRFTRADDIGGAVPDTGYADLTLATLRYWRHLGTGPDGFRLGRRVVHRREDLDRWLAEQQQARSSRRQRARPPGCVLERFLSISGRAQFAVSVRQ
jgi:hypothetical protein